MISISTRKRRSKIRKRTKQPLFKNFLIQHQVFFSFLGGLALIGGFILLIYIIFQQTFFSSKYTITQIIYAQQSIDLYDHPQVYKDISNALIGEKYYRIKRYELEETISQLQTLHPIIQDLEIQRQEDGSLFVTVFFFEPTLVFTTPSQQFGVYEGYFFDLVEGNILGTEVNHITLPAYTSGFYNLDGLLFKINEYQLNEMIWLITETLGAENLKLGSYLAGGSKMLIYYKEKLIFFHLDKDINSQLAKLIDLENFYPGWAEVTKIDIGSSDDVIFR